MEEKKTVLIELHYLPSLEYFVCLMNFDKIIIEAAEHFQKQTYRNRCYILGANKTQMLSIPVNRTGKKIPIREAKINNSQGWQREHWRSIESAYGKAPYYKFYCDIFKEIYFAPPEYLFDFNRKLLTVCLKLIGLNIVVEESRKYLDKPVEGVFDARGKIQPDKNPDFYMPIAYYQVFGNVFVPNLSIIDLLFCEGNNARMVLDKSIKSI